jgi:hypothetical protein
VVAVFTPSTIIVRRSGRTMRRPGTARAANATVAEGRVAEGRVMVSWGTHAECFEVVETEHKCRPACRCDLILRRS